MRTLTEKDVRRMLAQEIKAAGGQRAFGAAHGMSGQHVGRVEAGEKLSPAILKALGLEIASSTTTYKRTRK